MTASSSPSTNSSPCGDDWSHVANNLTRIREDIASAARAAGRSPDDVTLIAVTKTFPTEAIDAALEAGQTEFGENRVQEALPKIEARAGRGARFHLIGHLQHNKARHAGQFAGVQSLDSVRIAEAIAQRLGAPLPVLLEVSVAGEESKQGFAPDALPEALARIRDLPHLQVQGLMTVAPLVADPEETRPVFRELRRLRDRLGLETLSMGMTNDYDVAIAEGATMVRVGRAIFGDRPIAR